MHYELVHFAQCKQNENITVRKKTMAKNIVKEDSTQIARSVWEKYRSLLANHIWASFNSSIIR